MEHIHAKLVSEPRKRKIDPNKLSTKPIPRLYTDSRCKQAASIGGYVTGKQWNTYHPMKP